MARAGTGGRPGAVVPTRTIAPSKCNALTTANVNQPCGRSIGTSGRPGAVVPTMANANQPYRRATGDERTTEGGRPNAYTYAYACACAFGMR
ncbi:MAG: hypothetical protein FWH01_16830, partial [Oscillospiraceae bacterium]|nr:hypothetical protein [Oscillospiraceae bacterium]